MKQFTAFTAHIHSTKKHPFIRVNVFFSNFVYYYKSSFTNTAGNECGGGTWWVVVLRERRTRDTSWHVTVNRMKCDSWLVDVSRRRASQWLAVSTCWRWLHSRSTHNVTQARLSRTSTQQVLTAHKIHNNCLRQHVNKCRQRCVKVVTHVQDFFRKSLLKATFERKLPSVSLP